MFAVMGKGLPSAAGRTVHAGFLESQAQNAGRWIMTTQATWQVAVIYEDPASREAAVSFCDRMVERFWSQLGFDIEWWSFELLQKEASARAAAEKAATADLLVFATRPAGELPFHLQAWADTWLRRRGKREGVLVGLLAEGDETAERRLYFRHLAHRAGLDYLTEVPQSLSYPVPGSPESYSERADQVTSLLKGILHHPTPPQLVR